MTGDSPPPSGIVESLRALGDGLLAAVQDRLALLALEVQEEKLRLIRGVVWAGAAAGCALMLLIVLSLALVCRFWDTARLPVLAGLAVFYAAALAAAWLRARRHLGRTSRPFAATREEIARDRACLRPPS
jgi:uncharacterized membrane protein YqjE